MKTPSIAILMILAFCLVAAAEWLPLWSGGAPGGSKPPVASENEGEGGRLTDTEVPEYEVRLPEKSKRTGAAVVILPGGGYGILAMGHEGREVADWFNERGIVAVLVKYRVSKEDAAGFQFPVPLLDARRAIRVTRSRAKEWGVTPAMVGVMGFSAGGHLASMCATMWDEKFPQEGKDAADDGGVPVRNSMEFTARCAENKVPVVCHVFAQGGHGFGMKGKGDSANWAARLGEWLVGRKLANDA